MEDEVESALAEDEREKPRKRKIATRMVVRATLKNEEIISGAKDSKSTPFLGSLQRKISSVVYLLGVSGRLNRKSMEGF